MRQLKRLGLDVGGMSTVRGRFWLETALAAWCGALAALTLFQRDWIEALTGFDPDHHNGSFERAIVVGPVLVCVVVAAVARSEWRRPRVAAVPGR